MRKQEFEEKIEKYVFDVMKELGMDNELVTRKTLKQIFLPDKVWIKQEEHQMRLFL